ncbi:MAG: hypothetical protein IJA23_02235 [Clostridia bacterium]|nr:hypothetical protein [Clostridia bacterium]
MAKKKSKKSNSNLGKILYFIAAVLGVVAIVMMFVNTVKVPDTDLGVLGTVEGESYSGLKVAFGYKENDVAVFKFSFMGLLPYLLVLAGTVLVLVNALAKKGNKIFDFVSIAALIVAGVLFFIMPNFMVFADNLVGNIAAEIDYEIAIGAIVSAISAIASGAVVLVKTLLKK